MAQVNSCLIRPQTLFSGRPDNFVQWIIDRLKETKVSKDIKTNFMQFEADGRYNRVFDLAEEDIEG